VFLFSQATEVRNGQTGMQEGEVATHKLGGHRSGDGQEFAFISFQKAIVRRSCMKTYPVTSDSGG
jgi:hypothetical protein